MRPIIDKPCYIVLWHLRQLFLEYALQACQDDGALPPPVVVDHPELDFVVPLFDNSRLFGKGHNALDDWWGAIVGG